jgi:hypothetical protein
MSQVREQVWSQVKDFFFPYLYGHMDSGYISFNDYANEVLGIKFDVQDKFNAYKMTTESGCIYACDEFCVISQKPTKLMMKEGKLHNDGGSAWEYADGIKGYSLNGVIVPEYLAVTPAKDLDIEFFKKEKNADVKAEFLRKYGVNRLLEHGNKVDTYAEYKNKLWSESKYELWDLKNMFEGITRHQHCYFLKMLNQSTGSWHVEGVAPECNTLEKALAWRMKNKHTELVTVK